MDTKLNGQRVRDARIIRGLSIQQLAKLIGVSKQAISLYGDVAPLEDKIFLLSKELGFPIDYFYSEDKQPTRIAATYYRSQSASNKRDKNSQDILTVYMSQWLDVLEEFIVFPKENIPKIDSDVTTPEEAAEIVRDHWNLGGEPIRNLVGVLERNGIVVSEMSGKYSHIDAHYQRTIVGKKSRPVILIGGKAESAVRRRFSTAHELAHMLLHEQDMDVTEIDKEEFRRKEKEADRFAAALLLPAEGFRKDIGAKATNINRYEPLKRKWRVSIGAMIVRARDLGLLKPEEQQSLFRKYNYRQWGTHEPLDDTLAYEHPVLIQKAVDMIFTNGPLSPSDLFKEAKRITGIVLSAADVEEILGLRKGTLSLLPEDEEEDLLKLESKIMNFENRKRRY